MTMKRDVRKDRMPSEAVESVKAAMGYTGPERRCDNCGAFGDQEMDDRRGRPTRCEMNILWFPVDKGGYCKHWHASYRGEEAGSRQCDCEDPDCC